MKRKINRTKKRKILLTIGGKKQLFQITGFYGELKALQEAVNFLESIGTSREEIKRMLTEGAKNVKLESPKTKQQALDQLAWLIIIGGKWKDIVKLAHFLKERGANSDFLRKVMIQASEISQKMIFKKKVEEKLTEAIIDFLLKEHS